MKKMLSFIAVMALLILPLKVSASATYSHEVKKDANGIYTAIIYATITKGDTYSGFDGKLVATNSFIQDIQDTTYFKKDVSTVKDATNQSATVKMVYSNPDATSLDQASAYIGTGDKIEVLRFTYTHDDNASSTDDCYVTYYPDGTTAYKVTPNDPTNPKTGNVLPYVGIIAGIGLIGCAYVISKKSTKLYRI